ncbi:LamG-like jellyroll fold domain-containing protein [Jejuia spongiicola]|uniref:Ig-like domain-containing protein n=1 Tax=Jejuia spongiicola TaxID=2942207 RepID=A0ABT0QHH1_9FLAO|nr:LamG-like jellyroll fold domain-containing protein [Jejuia spongiicola]MCL6296441.1 Ig-like domain-containing protein [Jejuia spongiicola]
MKNIYKIFFGLLSFLLVLSSCNDGIDPITEVDPGADVGAPQVTLKYPVEGTKIKVNDPVVAITIEFEVTDDIEVDNITVLIDNNQIATMSDFKDYRRVLAEVAFDNVTTGQHELKVEATDINGQSTTATANFEKEPPYIPIFANETLYMDFESDFTEFITVTRATEVGTPGFAGQGLASNNAYAGAEDSYLTVPTNNLQLGNEISAVFWYKLNASPDRAGVLVIGPPDLANPDNQNNRNSGFRLFRENAGGMQRFKLNVGTGAGNTWVDGGTAADVDPAKDEWVNLAFTISATEARVYINGQLAKESTLSSPVDWMGCDILSIMSGAPRFTGWNHKSDNSFMDELRFFNTALSQGEIQNIIGVTNPYTPADGETMYVPFDDTYKNLVSGADATVVGTPSYAGESKLGSNAYAGAGDSYLSFPTTGLLANEFSATMWHKVNATPDRAGVLVIGPQDTANAGFPDVQNNRSSGFRFFRENAGGMQRFKLNVGNGTSDTWVDGGAAADVDPTANEWVHLAFTISGSKAIVYINGEVAKESDITGVDWTDCDILSIMSGAPRFTGWNHKSDSSFLDDLHLFNKALSQSEIQDIMGN